MGTCPRSNIKKLKNIFNSFIKILTKLELDDPELKVLNEIFEKTANQSPADGRILKLTNNH